MGLMACSEDAVLRIVPQAGRRGKHSCAGTASSCRPAASNCQATLRWRGHLSKGGGYVRIPPVSGRSHRFHANLGGWAYIVNIPGHHLPGGPVPAGFLDGLSRHFHASQSPFRPAFFSPHDCACVWHGAPHTHWPSRPSAQSLTARRHAVNHNEDERIRRL